VQMENIARDALEASPRPWPEPARTAPGETLPDELEGVK